MTGGFATVAGTVLAAFIGFGIDAATLISASFMAASLVVAVTADLGETLGLSCLSLLTRKAPASAACSTRQRTGTKSYRRQPALSVTMWQ